MILIRYSEIFLKGKNRPEFERRLVENIRLAPQQNNSSSKVILKRARILVDDDPMVHLLEKIPGIQNFSVSEPVSLDILEMRKKAISIAKTKKFNSFKVSCQRMDKDFFMNSMEIERSVGEEIFENMHKKVDLKKPELTIFIEIAEKKAFIFTEKIQGIGGLPIGISGRIFALIEDEQGLNAARLMMKRGCIVFPVYFQESTYLEKIQELSPGFKIKSFKITDFKELLSHSKKLKINTISVSDKIENIKKYNTNLLVLRPLISVLENENIP